MPSEGSPSISPQQGLDSIVVQIGSITREDVVLLSENEAIVEKALVLHNCQPLLQVGDAIIAVNDKSFESPDELSQLAIRLSDIPILATALQFVQFASKNSSLLTEAAQNNIKLTVTINRQRGKSKDESSIDRYVIELKRDSENIPFGITPIADNEYVFVGQVDGMAAEAGVREKDHIKRINGEAIQSMEDYNRLTKGQLKIVLYIARGSKIVRSDVQFERKLVTIHIPYESGDVLGITVKNLTVTKIQSGSIAESKFELQDQLIDINGTKLNDDKDVYNLLQRIDDDLEVNVLREVAKSGSDTQSRACATSSSTAINRVLISLAMAPCDALGVRPDENMMISRITDKSHAQGKFELGDVIKTLNGTPVNDRNQFSRLLEDATTEGRVNIIVERSAERELELEKRLLPPSVEKIIKRHAGFDYIVVNVRYDSSGKRPFGLNIANVTSHKIIIPELGDNVVAGDYLKVFDHIIAINGVPVSDVAVAKKMIRECRANFQAVIERPVTLESNAEIKREVDEWRRKMARPTNLEQMPADVQEIVQKHLKTRRTAHNLISALRKPSGKPRKIHFSERHTETQIQSDIPPTKRLRSCR